MPSFTSNPTTPIVYPPSWLTLPPKEPKTSPALSRVVQAIRAAAGGSDEITPYWSEYPLSSQEFEVLKAFECNGMLKAQNLRYDYSASDEIFALRMPNHAKHEIFRCDVWFEIRNQVKAFSEQRDGSAASQLAQSILMTGHTNIYYSHPLSKGKMRTQRNPDDTFTHEGQIYPSCVVEIASSHTTKNLPKLAEEYIFATGAAVRTVVGFDLAGWGKEAKLSIWRPKLNANGFLIGTECEVVEMRSKDGVRNRDTEAGLRLSLEDFAYRRDPDVLAGLDQVHIFIPVSDLCDMLERGEKACGAKDDEEEDFDSLSMISVPRSEHSSYRSFKYLTGLIGRLRGDRG